MFGSISGAAVLFIVACCAFIICARRRSTSGAETKSPPIVPEDIETAAGIPSEPQSSAWPALPDHIVLEKDDTLKDKVKELAGNKKLLEKEFNLLDEFARKNFTVATSVADLEVNKTHNRYTDQIITFNFPWLS